MVYSPEKDSNDPKEWRAEVVFTDLCTECNVCIAVCPVQAIHIR
jgi:ferredoxin